MIEWLYGLQLMGVKLGLENIRALLRILGRPERSYPSVLVAGTNGKGSVAAMVQAMLGATGVEAGLFTSPHLMRPNERIRIAADDIGDDELELRLRRIRERIETGLATGDLTVHPSFFEVMTATALETFRDHGVRAALLEIGLGGRLDATNAVDAELAVVVSIDLDHVKTLGPTLERIAGEKAGIIKPGKPLVSGAVRQSAVSVLQRVCRERGAEWIDARRAVRFVSEQGETFTLETDRQRYDDLRLSLPGRHQIDNARIALAAFERFAPRVGVEPEPDAVRRALAGVRWPGRLQWIRGKGAIPDLLLDGAHNPDGTRTLAEYLRSRPEPPPVALFGVMQGKLLSSMIETLAPLVHSLVVTRPDVKRAAEPEEVAALARPAVGRVEVIAEPRRALERAIEIAGSRRPVLVTGSLYLVGQILSLLRDRPVPGPVSM